MLSHSRNIYSLEVLEKTQQRKNLAESRKDSLTPISSPKLRRKKPPGITVESEGKLQELLDQYEEEKKKTKKLYEDSVKTQEKRIKREKETKRLLSEQEELLCAFNSFPPQGTIGKYREKMRKTHQKILEQIEVIQTKTIEFLQRQERLVVKDMNQELNKCYKALEDNEKNNSKKKTLATKESLHSDIIYNRARVEEVEMKNNHLQKTNRELKTEFKSYGNDIEILKNNIEILRQQNAKLKSDFSTLTEKQHMSKTQDFFHVQPKAPKTDRLYTSTSNNSYIESLKRMIEIEKKNLRAARNAYSRELGDRNELETILRQAIDDVSEVGRGKQSSRGATSSRRKLSPVKESRKEAILLLYSKAFPVKKNYKKVEVEDIDSDALIEHLDKNIQNIEKLYSQHEEDIQYNTERAQMGYS